MLKELYNNLRSLRKHPFLLSLFVAGGVSRTSPAAKSEEKWMFSQATICISQKSKLIVHLQMPFVLRWKGRRTKKSVLPWIYFCALINKKSWLCCRSDNKMPVSEVLFSFFAFRRGFFYLNSYWFFRSNFHWFITRNTSSSLRKRCKL